MQTVLIVEDSPYYYNRAGQIVENLGIKPYFAHTGKQGVEMYEKIQPDFVIMDICMPVMDGLEATLQITKKYNDAKIVICSSVGNVPIYRKQAIKNGAKTFLPKEFNVEELKEVIEELKLYN